MSADFIALLRDCDLQTAQKLLLERFAANERFFAQTDLAKYIETPNARLTLHLSPNGINVKDGDRHLFKTNAIDEAINLAQNPLNNPRYEAIIIQNHAKEEAEQNRFTCEGVNEIIDVAEKDADFTPNQAHFDTTAPLPPVVFYGAGAHIAILDENDSLSNGAMIYESDPERFVISCYFIDYERFLETQKNNLLIVGGRAHTELASRFFISDRFARNFVRLELLLENSAENIDARMAIAVAHKGALRGWGTSEDESVGVKNAIKNANYPRLKSSQKIDAPIVVVGNGASLDSLYDFLRKNEKKALIFSAGTALKPLLSAGIKPDFHIEIERMGHLANILSDAPIGDIPLICADLVDPSTLTSAKESYVFARDSSAASAFSEKKINFSSPIVGNAAFSLALEFSNEVYICGLDVGFRRDTKMHAKKSFYEKLKDDSAERLPTRGNFSGDVYTNSLLSSSRAAIEAAIAINPNAKVFNLSDGAFIIGAKPLRPNEAQIAYDGDKNEAIAAIKSCFGKSDRGEKIDIKYELNEAKKRLISNLNRFSAIDKKDLFAAAKEAYISSLAIEKDLPFGAPFLRGSFWRLINATTKTLLCVRRSDLSALYKKDVEIIEKTLEKLFLLF
jgi:hypothetical protein